MDDLINDQDVHGMAQGGGEANGVDVPFQIRGPCSATLTPFQPSGEGICAEMISKDAEWQRDNGIKTVFVAGTTGESMSLSLQERMDLAMLWSREAKTCGIKVVMHVGSASCSQSRALAAHAQAVGCDAIAVMAPSFFKPGGAADLAAFLQAVAAGAPRLPCYYYHFPDITGVDISPLELFKAIEAIGVPTFRGVKFTDFDLHTFMMCSQYAGGRYDVVFGRDEAMLGGLATGAQGFIGNGFTIAPRLYRGLMDAYACGDIAEARRLQARSCQLVTVLNDKRWSPVACCKAIMLRRGLDFGPCRLPLRTLSSELCDALEAELARIGFVDWC